MVKAHLALNVTWRADVRNGSVAVIGSRLLLVGRLADGEGDREAVEGFLAAHTIFGRRTDRCQHAFQIHSDIIGRNAQHCEAVRLQPCGSSSIMRDLVRMLMARAVYFDGEANLGAVEVEHIRTDGVLAAEFKIGQSASAQADPEPGFRRRHSATQDAGSRYGYLGTQEPLRLSAFATSHLPIASQRGGEIKFYPNRRR